MRKYNYSYLEKLALPPYTVSLMNQIERLDSRKYFLSKTYSETLPYLEKLARIQSVKASNEIEGIITTDERIKAIVNEKVAPKNHSEQEIAGYRDALDYIHTNFNKIKEIDSKEILHINKIMQSKNEDKDIIGGEYKKENVNIVRIDNFGHKHLRFKTVDYKFVNKNMQYMLESYDYFSNSNKINSLLLIACFILDFLCIHPFKDGNGRMSRLLSVLLLEKNGYDVVKYISFENEISKSRDYYYESLQESSYKWHENKNDYIPFINNFLYTLLRCYRELNKRFVLVKDKKPTKKQRVYELIKLNIVPTSKSELIQMLPDVKPRTIELTLNELMKNKKIKKIGTFKNAKYETL